MMVEMRVMEARIGAERVRLATNILHSALSCGALQRRWPVRERLFAL
jgi:hypothetical protein